MTTGPTVLISPTSSDAGVVMMRQLAAAGIFVVGADDGGLPVGIRSRYCRAYRRAAEAKGRKVEEYVYLPDVVEAARPDALVPIDTPATLAAVRHHERIAAVTSTNLPSLDSFMAAYDKQRCQMECRSLGIPCPITYPLDEARAVLQDGCGGPTLVVKPNVDRGTGRGVRYVREVARLEEAVRACREDHGGVMIQEFIPGDVSQQHMAIMLFSPESRLMAAFTSRKLRQWPAGCGASAVSESTANACLVDQMLPFFERWQWRGPAEVELKFDHRDGLFKVIEINPRFPGYLRFVPHCGLDMPLLAARLALDPGHAAPVAFPAYSVGERFLSPGLFGKSVLDEIAGGGTGTWSAAVRDLHGTSWVLRELLADPLPPLARMLFPSG